jgi:hypothetical protein
MPTLTNDNTNKPNITEEPPPAEPPFGPSWEQEPNTGTPPASKPRLN